MPLVAFASALRPVELRRAFSGQRTPTFVKWTVYIMQVTDRADRACVLFADLSMHCPSRIAHGAFVLGHTALGNCVDG